MDHEPLITSVQNDRGLVDFALRHAHFTIVLFIGVLLSGLVSLVLIPKDLLPAGKAPAVQILSFYNGMPVENVEQEMTYPFERYTGQAVGIASQESRSLTGVSIVRNYFHSSMDLSSAMSQTGSLVMSVLRKLPPGTQPPLILPFDPMSSLPLAVVTISGKGKSETELQDLGRYFVINAIQSVPGAMAPTVFGGRLRQAMVLLDRDKLTDLNLSPLRVAQKIEAMNSFVPAGDINVGELDYQLQTNAMFKNLDEVNYFYLRSRNGHAVKVSDVGRSEDGSARQTNIVTVDGQRQVYIPVYRQLGSNSIKVIDDVRQSIRRLQDSLQGVQLDVVNDQTIFIRRAIEAISVEALVGGFLAALMIYLFLGSGRGTVAALLTIPISVIGSIAVLRLFGHTLNIMTLGGLALSIGVLVDNAIVVIEVIMAKQELGMNPRVAARIGAREVAMPILASTIATLVVFLPVLFLMGNLQTLFSALAVAVIAAMGISYYAAMMMVPLFAYHWLGVVQISQEGFLAAIQRFFARLTEGYGRSLTWALKHTRPILAGSFVLHAAVAGGLIFFIGAELFPRVDSGSFTINMRGKTGLRVEKTSELALAVEKKLREIIPAHDLRMVISNSGVFYGYSAAFTRNAGPQDSSITVELKDDRNRTTQDYAKTLRQKLSTEFPGVEFSFELGGLMTSALNGGLASPIEVQIGGKDSAQSFAIAEALLPKIKKLSGAADVHIQQRFDAPIMSLNINRQKVSNLGLTPDLVVKNVVSAVSNSSSFDPLVWVDPTTGIDYLLGVQFPENAMETPEALLSIPITSPDQERSVRLRDFTTLTLTKGPTEINHRNLMPAVDIYLDAQDRDIFSLSKDVQRLLDQESIPKGYWMDIRGEISEMRSSMVALAWGFVLAACLVYLILVVQFKSFLMPALILTNVPKGVVGVIVMLAVTHTYFSIQAAIGCIFVIGVSVSHGVLLLEYILRCTKGAADFDGAIVEASMARLRPITMTSLASILGLLPMAIGIGHGAEANTPLGRAVIGGQLLSTFLNFYLLPCLFRQVTSKQWRAKAEQIPLSDTKTDVA